VDLNARDDCGWTPIHYASDHLNPHLIRALGKLGADPNPLCDHGEAPIHALIRAYSKL
jgi:ankyrin repeat protein